MRQTRVFRDRNARNVAGAGRRLLRARPAADLFEMGEGKRSRFLALEVRGKGVRRANYHDARLKCGYAVMRSGQLGEYRRRANLHNFHIVQVCCNVRFISRSSAPGTNVAPATLPRVSSRVLCPWYQHRARRLTPRFISRSSAPGTNVAPAVAPLGSSRVLLPLVPTSRPPLHRSVHLASFCPSYQPRAGRHPARFISRSSSLVPVRHRGRYIRYGRPGSVECVMRIFCRHVSHN